MNCVDSSSSEPFVLPSLVPPFIGTSSAAHETLASLPSDAAAQHRIFYPRLAVARPNAAAVKSALDSPKSARVLAASARDDAEVIDARKTASASASARSKATSAGAPSASVLPSFIKRRLQ